MSLPLEKITFYELLEMALDNRQRDIHVAMPGIIQAYDPQKQTCTVTPQFVRQIPDGAGNFIPDEPFPDMQDVPVAFQCGGGYQLTFPLQKGDEVLIVICEQNIGNWRSLGAQCDPGDVAMHGFSGATVYPGLRSDSKALANASGSTMKAGSDTDANGRIEFKPAEIDLGEGATLGVARETDTVAAATTPPGPTSMSGWISAVSVALSLTPPVNFGVISSSSAHIKAVD